MGCMHAFMWGEAHPDFVDAMMPLACLSAEIVGRNRMWPKMTIDAIISDPDWKRGNYETQPKKALRTAANLLIIAGGGVLTARIVGKIDTALVRVPGSPHYIASRPSRLIAKTDNIMGWFAKYNPVKRMANPTSNNC